jgi:hypothetical protein
LNSRTVAASAYIETRYNNLYRLRRPRAKFGKIGKTQKHHVTNATTAPGSGPKSVETGLDTSVEFTRCFA